MEYAGAKLRVARVVGDDILEVEAPVSIAVPSEIPHRISAAQQHVADVELKSHGRQIESLDENIVRDDSARADRLHVIRLVVKREPDAGATSDGARCVEVICPPAPFVGR